MLDSLAVHVVATGFDELLQVGGVDPIGQGRGVPGRYAPGPAHALGGRFLQESACLARFLGDGGVGLAGGGRALRVALADTAGVA